MFVDAYVLQRPPRRAAEIRHDHRGMPDDRKHGVPLIDRALTDVRPWMRVYIGEYLYRLFLAVLPKGRIPLGMEGDGSVLLGARIDVVVANVGRDALRRGALAAEQKRAALAPASALALQVGEEARPEPDRNANSGGCRVRRQCSPPS